MNSQVLLAHGFADIWIAVDSESPVDYYYGGTRMIHPKIDHLQTRELLRKLMLYESAFKNRLINIALRGNILRHQNRLPAGFVKSTVGGARCVIRPKNEQLYAILSNPAHPKFQTSIQSILAKIGDYLNQEQGRIKLTPDFGHFSGLADILATFTPHVLGIRCENGGCGGKTSYSSTGVIAALEALDIVSRKSDPMTLIGSAGAMGTDILAYLCRENFLNVRICDVIYNDPKRRVSPRAFPTLPSQDKRFTDDCLARGGIIIATTVGEELQNSHWWLMPPGTILFLAHNLAIPPGENGINLMRQIAKQGIYALPGQILTLGGALTSRLEWFWRQSHSHELFDKQLAHLVVKEVIQFLICEIQKIVGQSGLSPYEAILQYAHFTD